MDNEEVLEHISTCEDLLICAREEIQGIYGMKEITDYIDIALEELKRKEDMYKQ